jgi:TolA-binding protein
VAGKAGSTTATVPAGDPNQMYQSAYLDYTKGNYDLAVSGFREYLKSFPDAEFAGNAQYWVGESLYSLGKYDEAVVEFEKVIRATRQARKYPVRCLRRATVSMPSKNRKMQKRPTGS